MLSKENIKNFWKAHGKTIICCGVGITLTGIVSYKFGWKKGYKTGLPFDEENSNMIKQLFADAKPDTAVAAIFRDYPYAINELGKLGDYLIESGTDPNMLVGRFVIAE